MKKLFVAVAAATALSLSACSMMPMQSSGSYDDIVAEAKATHAETVKAGFNWKQKKMKKPYVDHYLALAEEAKAKGDDAAAMKNAKEALKVAKAEKQQMTAEPTIGWLK